jgi:hypothetical protein
VRILFDQGVPEPLRQLLKKHEIATAYEKGWSTLSNGDLLDAAERDGYRTFVTTDSNLKYHQNLRTRTIGIVVLLSTSWPRIQQAIDSIAAAVDSASPGSYLEVEIP